jgi:hypothetical protein
MIGIEVTYLDEEGIKNYDCLIRDTCHEMLWCRDTLLRVRPNRCTSNYILLLGYIV